MIRAQVGHKRKHPDPAAPVADGAAVALGAAPMAEQPVTGQPVRAAMYGAQADASAYVHLQAEPVNGQVHGVVAPAGFLGDAPGGLGAAELSSAGL